MGALSPRTGTEQSANLSPDTTLAEEPDWPACAPSTPSSWVALADFTPPKPTVDPTTCSVLPKGCDAKGLANGGEDCPNSPCWLPWPVVTPPALLSAVLDGGKPALPAAPSGIKIGWLVPDSCSHPSPGNSTRSPAESRWVTSSTNRMALAWASAGPSDNVRASSPSSAPSLYRRNGLKVTSSGRNRPLPAFTRKAPSPGRINLFPPRTTLATMLYRSTLYYLEFTVQKGLVAD